MAQREAAGADWWREGVRSRLLGRLGARFLQQGEKLSITKPISEMPFIWLHVHYLVWSSGQLCKGQLKKEAGSDAWRGQATAGKQESDPADVQPTFEET